MVSFFKKKKKSAEATKDGKDAKAQEGLPAPSSSIVAVEANAGSSVPNTKPPPVPANAAKPPPGASAKRSASMPSKRRNFLSGSLRGSRSSVSRLPAVQEEIPTSKSVVTPNHHEEEHGTTITQSTPSTATFSTPDLLGTLSYDDQEEGEVEILTPDAKDTVKKQLKFDTPDRGSRVASMEISPDGIVSQISQDEDADILLGTTTATITPSMESKHTRSFTTASTDTSTVPPQQMDSVSAGSHTQTSLGSPYRSSLVPKPKSSPQSTTSQDKEDQETHHEEEKVSERQTDEGTRQTMESVASASYDEMAAEVEETEVFAEPGPTEALPPTRTISLEQNRLNLVSPLTLHPAAKGGHNMEDIDEEEDTLEETAAGTQEHTYDSSGNNWSKTSNRLLNRVTKSIMGTFQCTPEKIQKISDNPIQGAMSMFYDGVCKPEDVEENPRRPYFNEDFAQRFVTRMLTNGMSLLYLQPPQTTSNPSDDWKGRTVVMRIIPGSTGSQDAIQPKLQWTTMAGGTVTKSFVTSIPLIRIHSVLTATQNLVPEDSTTADLDDEDLCFVSITSTAGKVFLFEANSVRERDEIANGLRNIIARLSFHLVAGDHKASSELYNDDRAIRDETEPGELPALASPKLNMNRMTHLLLDV
eukprot:scaffold8471_cov184-Amphora_coffeaeformis.AAC.17